jgi:hypothetical protein
MKMPSRVQWLLIAVLAVAAVALAIPAMHDTPIEKFFRGECGPPHSGRYFSCPPKDPLHPN